MISVAILLIAVLAALGFGPLGEMSCATLSLEVPAIGSIPIVLSRDTPEAGRELQHVARGAENTAKLHRVEPLPPAGSSGPPYALVQFTVNKGDKLKSRAHEGSAKIARGSVCLIGGASDLFISLARNGEHDGWEQSMTVVGHVPEPELTTHVEEQLLKLPVHNFTHPQYGTVMSMLDKEIECRLRCS